LIAAVLMAALFVGPSTFIAGWLTGAFRATRALEKARREFEEARQRDFVAVEKLKIEVRDYMGRVDAMAARQAVCR
jgi:hypothetical protein